MKVNLQKLKRIIIKEIKNLKEIDPVKGRYKGHQKLSQETFYSQLGSPQTPIEASQAYTTWYRQNSKQTSCPDGSSVNTPSQFNKLINGKGQGQGETRALPWFAWLAIGCAAGWVAHEYFGSSGP